jgi:hypothetical protein
MMHLLDLFFYLFFFLDLTFNQKWDPFIARRVMWIRSKGVWQGVAMDSLKFHTGLPYPTLLCSAGWPTPETTVSGVARPQWWPAVFYPSKALDTPRSLAMDSKTEASEFWSENSDLW